MYGSGAGTCRVPQGQGLKWKLGAIFFFIIIINNVVYACVMSRASPLLRNPNPSLQAYQSNSSSVTFVSPNTEHKHETNVFNLRLQNQPATDPSSNLQTDCSSSSSSSSGNRRLTQSPESCPPCVHTHALKTNKNYSVDNQGLIQIFVLPSINKSVNLLHRS